MAAAAVIIPLPLPPSVLPELRRGYYPFLRRPLEHTYSVMYMQNWYKVCRKSWELLESGANVSNDVKS